MHGNVLIKRHRARFTSGIECWENTREVYSVVFSQHSLRTDKLVAKRQKAYAEHLKHKPNECGKTFAKGFEVNGYGLDTPDAIRQHDAIFRFSLTDKFDPSLNCPNI